MYNKIILNHEDELKMKAYINLKTGNISTLSNLKAYFNSNNDIKDFLSDYEEFDITLNTFVNSGCLSLDCYTGTNIKEYIIDEWKGTGCDKCGTQYNIIYQFRLKIDEVVEPDCLPWGNDENILSIEKM